MRRFFRISRSHSFPPASSACHRFSHLPYPGAAPAQPQSPIAVNFRQLILAFKMQHNPVPKDIVPTQKSSLAISIPQIPVQSVRGKQQGPPFYYNRLYRKVLDSDNFWHYSQSPFLASRGVLLSSPSSYRVCGLQFNSINYWYPWRHHHPLPSHDRDRILFLQPLLSFSLRRHASNGQYKTTRCRILWSARFLFLICWETWYHRQCPTDLALEADAPSCSHACLSAFACKRRIAST